jgi:hypothetical protein
VLLVAILKRVIAVWAWLVAFSTLLALLRPAFLQMPKLHNVDISRKAFVIWVRAVDLLTETKKVLPSPQPLLLSLLRVIFVVIMNVVFAVWVKLVDFSTLATPLLGRL